MLKNYIKVTLRNLSKNKVYVIINVFGLGLALSCCIVAYLNTQFDWGFDKSHSNIDNIYKVHLMKENQGQLQEHGTSPMPLATAIANDFTGMDRVFRFAPHIFSVRDVNQNKVFSTRVCFANKGFLESFTFPLISGNPQAYHQLDQAVVTKTYARKFYGEEDPVGKVLTIFNDNGISFNYIISGVVEKAPLNSSVQFEVLINFENRYRMYQNIEKGDWSHFTSGTFLYFNDPKKAKKFEPMLKKYVAVQNNARPDWKVSKYILTPMNNHAHIADQVLSERFWSSLHPAAVVAPQVMAILILLIACFNFTNTAIATSSKRLKEIGIRKVIGGTRSHLIIQFMSENLIVCFLAILTSLLFAFFLVPAYSAMWEGMDLEMNFTQNIGLYGFLFGLLVFTAVLAGLYPSMYISKYEPVKILRGNLKIGGTSMFSKVLLALQYSFTVVAIFASVAFIQNAGYQDELDMGFNRDQILGVSVLNNNEYQKVKESMEANPIFTSIAGTSDHIGRGDYNATLKNQDTEVESSMLNFGPGYIETMELKIVEGRGFTKDLESTDIKKSLIVNEKMVEEFGWTKPLGQRIILDDTTTLTVIGVMKNYYMYGYWDKIGPVGMRLSAEKNFNYLIGKVDFSNITKSYDYLEDEWMSKIPTREYDGFYQDDLLKEAKEVNGNIIVIFSFLGIIAVALSCIGLFTLVSLNIIRRVKEIGVRKVLGGSVVHIIELINREYLILLIVSSVLGVTMGYYLIDMMIASIFVYYKEVDFFTFGIPAIIIVGISLAISSTRILIAALQNPIDSLRYE